MLPLFAILPLADPVARLDAFLKAHPSFTATVEALRGERATGRGTVRVVRPGRLRFDAKGDGFDYTLLTTATAFIDLDRVQKVYDERPPIGRLQRYESRISSAQALFPNFLLAPSAKGMMSGGKTTSVAVAGGDEVRASLQTQTGPLEIRLLVGPSGQPLRYSEKSVGGEQAWRVVAFGPAPADPAVFVVPAPLGYVPHALPELSWPLPIGESAPLVGWRRAGRAIDLNEPSRGRPRLLAVLGADCPASRAARPFLAELERSMPVFRLEKGGVEDPTGALMRRLSPPGTPMFYLVGMDGTVKRLWFGFDPAKGKAWEAEVREAAK